MIEATRRCVAASKRKRETAGDIAEQAEERLQNNPYFALRKIRCECRDGVLVLRGQVASYYLKQLAHQAVHTIDGVGRVVNDVTVPRAALG